MVEETRWTHVSGDEVGHEVERDPPPDGAEDVAGGVLRPAQHADGVVDLGQVLEQERHQQHGHDGGRRARAYHRRRRRPDDHLRSRVRPEKGHGVAGTSFLWGRSAVQIVWTSRPGKEV